MLHTLAAKMYGIFLTTYQNETRNLQLLPPWEALPPVLQEACSAAATWMEVELNKDAILRCQQEQPPKICHVCHKVIPLGQGFLEETLPPQHTCLPCLAASGKPQESKQEPETEGRFGKVCHVCHQSILPKQGFLKEVMHTCDSCLHQKQPQKPSQEQGQNLLLLLKVGAEIVAQQREACDECFAKTVDGKKLLLLSQGWEQMVAEATKEEE